MQLDLFSHGPSEPTVAQAREAEAREVPRVVGTVADEKKRTGSQCDAILARLQEGAATNHELAEISLKYTSRVSDLRKRGVNVECVEINRETGLSVYRIKETP